MAIDRYPDLPSYKKSYPFRHTFPRGDKNRFRAYKASAAANTDVASMAVGYLNSMSLGKREGADMLALAFSLNPYPYA